jgi:fructoselysine-6-P-deglycase FrlB-like protein
LVRNQIFEEIAQAADIALPAYENAFNTLTQSNINPTEIKLITTISRGSSSCATEFLSQALTNNPNRTRALDPALFYDDEKPSFSQDEIVIALSQSGETGEVVNALKYASKFTSNTIAIHNSKNSSLSTAAFWDIFLDAGVEKSVPATKSVVAQLAAILAIHDWFTGTNNKEQITEYEEAFDNPYIAAERGWIDAVITPSETRARIVKSLRMLRTKRETLPSKKHGNIPL